MYRYSLIILSFLMMTELAASEKGDFDHYTDFSRWRFFVWV